MTSTGRTTPASRSSRTSPTGCGAGRIVLLVTWRAEELEDEIRNRLTAGAEGDGLAVRIGLGRLDRAAVAELAAASLGAGRGPGNRRPCTRNPRAFRCTSRRRWHRRSRSAAQPRAVSRLSCARGSGPPVSWPGSSSAPRPSSAGRSSSRRCGRRAAEARKRRSTASRSSSGAGSSGRSVRVAWATSATTSATAGSATWPTSRSGLPAGGSSTDAWRKPSDRAAPRATMPHVGR